MDTLNFDYKLCFYRSRNKMEVYPNNNSCGSFTFSIYNAKAGGNSGGGFKNYDYKDGEKLYFSLHEISKMKLYFQSVLERDKGLTISYMEKDISFYHKFQKGTVVTQKILNISGNYNDKKELQFLVSIKNMVNNKSFYLYLSPSEMLEILDYCNFFIGKHYIDQFNLFSTAMLNRPQTNNINPSSAREETVIESGEEGKDSNEWN